MLRCCQGRTHGEYLYVIEICYNVEIRIRLLSQSCVCFVARYFGNGSHPQTDSIPGTDLHHYHLSGGADPWRLPEYCQLLQVKAGSAFLLHFF